jgi:kinetochore protein NDC80
MRRTTLGPTNGAPPGRAAQSSVGGMALKPHDRRASAAPSFSGRRQSSMAPSVAGGFGGAGGRRQSSIPGRRGPSMAHGGRRTDSRPLHDRAFMQTCTKDIVSFVLQNGYSMPISPKILTNPSSRDFQNIFLFLVRYVDPSFEFRGRFEDEIPALLKRVGYPFTVSKSALSAVGSPHAWPALLGVLTWILELIKYDLAKGERDDADADGGIAAGGLVEEEDGVPLHSGPTEEEFQPFIVQAIHLAYDDFLVRENDTHPELDRQFQEQTEAKNAGVRERVAAQEERHAERSESLAAMRAQPETLVQLEQHRATLKENITKFNMLLPSQRDHKAGVDRKLADKLAEAESLEHAIQEKQGAIASLQAIVASQVAASIDVEKIASDRANAKQMLAKLGVELATAEDELKEAMAESARHEAAISDGQRQYRKDAESIMFIPETARNANGVDFRIELNDDQVSLSTEVGDRVLPALRGLKDGYYKRHAELQSEELTMQDRLDAFEDELMHRGDGKRKLETRLAKEDRVYKSEKAAMAEQLRTSSETVAKSEEEIGERLRKAEESARESARSLESTESQLRMFQENFASERNRMGRALLRHIERLHGYMMAAKQETPVVSRYFADEKIKAEEMGDATVQFDDGGRDD